MTTSVPAHIDALHGESRRKAVHEWRVGVHRHRRNIGFAVLAVAAAILVSLAALGVTVSMQPMAVFFLGVVLGGAGMYVVMHERKMLYHKGKV